MVRLDHPKQGVLSVKLVPYPVMTRNGLATPLATQGEESMTFTRTEKLQAVRERAESWAYAPGSPLCVQGHEVLDLLGVPHGIGEERAWQSARYEITP